MAKRLIVGNWKSNKSIKETLDFFEEFQKAWVPNPNTEVVICPSYLTVSAASNFVRAANLDVAVGVQDVSPFEEGAYTGEVSADQAREVASYVIIGHSERRKNFGETDDIVAKKVTLAVERELKTIVCVSEISQLIPSSANYIAYEPLSAIGTGNPADPESVNKIFGELKRQNPDKIMLYGGSVNENDVANYFAIENLGGFLIGGASLDPLSFTKIISQC